MSTKNTLCAKLVGDTSDLFCKLVESVNHSIDDVLELDHVGTVHGDGDLMGQVAAGDSVADANDVANLSLHEKKLIDCTCVRFECGITEGTGMDKERDGG